MELGRLQAPDIGGKIPEELRSPDPWGLGRYTRTAQGLGICQPLLACLNFLPDPNIYCSLRVPKHYKPVPKTAT